VRNEQCRSGVSGSAAIVAAAILRVLWWSSMKLNSGLLALCFGLACAGAASSAQADVLIKVDKAAQRMTVSVDGAQRHVWAVSTGRSGYITPSGSYTPFRLEADHYSKEWDDAPMPHSIFFTKDGHAIHGSFDTRRLGSPASHGCVRLAPSNAAALFALVKKEGLANTKVVLSGETPVSAPAVAKRKPARSEAVATRRWVEDPSDVYARAPAREYGAPSSYYQQQPSYGRRILVYPDGRMVESWN
jgi:hypothetical protein